jgi:ABC-type antimicrobial peptide transport system permease subunit
MQRYAGEQILHVRTAGEPLATAYAVEQAIHDLNADLPLYNVTTFGLLALILAAVGIYGVVAYSTRQRTHEIGIRMALGAGQGDVFRQVLGRGLRLALAGLFAGLVVSFAFTRYLRGMLFGVGTVDWITFVSVAAVLFLVAMAACYLPARRAASVDPMQALRTE